MELDQQPTVDPTTLDKLITKKTKAENNKLQKELDSLKKQLTELMNSKNIRKRGNGGASNKNQKAKNVKSTPKSSPKKPKAKKADDANNDSRKNNSKQSKKPLRKETRNQNPCYSSIYFFIV